MKDTTKTIIIGSVITILVLVLAIFILYKTSTKKVNVETSPNKTEYNNSTTTTNLNNNEDSNPNNTSIDNNNPIENNTSTTPTHDNETNSKVILYLFHGATCPACNNAIKTIKEERNTTFKNVEIRTYEIWGNNNDNKQLLSKVTSKLNVTAKYIPYFIVGDYSKDGFNSETLLEEYKKALNNKNYKDIVQETIKENPNLNPVYETI